MPFTIIRNDITKIQTDAIVNAANIELQMGAGVCGAIFKAAGVKALQEACKKLSPIQTGEAVITPGFALFAKYIIHTAGPVYRDGTHGEADLLRACYLNSLAVAEENDCASIAFPLISSGVYGYPKANALQVATQAIQDYLAEHEMDIYLAVFDKDAFAISEQLLGSVESYIDEHYVDEHLDRRREKKSFLDAEHAELFAEEALSIPIPPVAKGLAEVMENLDEPFSQTLLRLIDAKGKTDVEVYKRANIDRRLFSKIRSSKAYMPSKRTIIALAIALELSLREAEEFLHRAGYAFSHSQKFDVIVEYFIVEGRYDIFEINEVLFHYDQPVLGG